MRLMKTNEKGLSPQFPPTPHRPDAHSNSDRQEMHREGEKKGEKRQRRQRKKLNRRAEKRPSVFTDVMTLQG